MHAAPATGVAQHTTHSPQAHNLTNPQPWCLISDRSALQLATLGSDRMRINTGSTLPLGPPVLDSHVMRQAGARRRHHASCMPHLEPNPWAPPADPLLPLKKVAGEPGAGPAAMQALLRACMRARSGPGCARSSLHAANTDARSGSVSAPHPAPIGRRASRCRRAGGDRS